METSGIHVQAGGRIFAARGQPAVGVRGGAIGLGRSSFVRRDLSAIDLFS